MIDNNFISPWLSWLIVLPGLFLLLFFKTKKAGNYILKNNFLTPAEVNFYKVLQTALADTDYIIFAKVKLGDLFRVSSPQKSFYSYWNRIRSKHVDFLICDKDIKPIAVIELDDQTHLTNEKTITSDKFKNELFLKNKFPLIRIKVQRSYNVEQIREEVLNKTHPFQA